MNRFLLLNRALAALLCATALWLAARWLPAAWFALPAAQAQHASLCQQLPGCAGTHTEVRFDPKAGRFAPYIQVVPVRNSVPSGKRAASERTAVDSVALLSRFQSAYLAQASQAPWWRRGPALSARVEVRP
jgi:hypothetical protein